MDNDAKLRNFAILLLTHGQDKTIQIKKQQEIKRTLKAVPRFRRRFRKWSWVPGFF